MWEELPFNSHFSGKWQTLVSHFPLRPSREHVPAKCINWTSAYGARPAWAFAFAMLVSYLWQLVTSQSTWFCLYKWQGRCIALLSLLLGTHCLCSPRAFGALCSLYTRPLPAVVTSLQDCDVLVAVTSLTSVAYAFHASVSNSIGEFFFIGA